MTFEKQRRQQFLGETRYLTEKKRMPESIVYFAHNPVGSGSSALQKDMLARQTSAEERLDLLFLKYTAGEPIEPLRTDLEEVVAAYECYGEHLWKYTGDRNEVVFTFVDLDGYSQLMQLIGLCFLLHRRDLLPRLAALQDGMDAIGPAGEGNGGSDWIYEEFMSHGLGAETRFESEQLCCSKPYECLADALSSVDNDTALKDLNLFLKHWYKDLAGTAWHDCHKPSEAGNMSGYYGYWSFEAGAAVLLLGIEDDSSLHKYLYYPKDLVAWARENADRFLGGALDAATKPRSNVPAGQPCPEAGWWFTPAQSGSRRYFKQDESMPSLGGDYGETLWQWSPDQSAPKL